MNYSTTVESENKKKKCRFNRKKNERISLRLFYDNNSNSLKVSVKSTLKGNVCR